MQPTKTFYQHLADAKEMLKNGIDISVIKENLVNNGADSNSIDEIILLLKPSSKSHKYKTGTFLLIIGLILLGFGFIASVLFTNNESLLNLSLYGITGIGAILLIIGLAMIFN